MQSKKANVKLFVIIAVLAGITGILATLLIVNSNQTPSLIASGSSIADARKLSAGKKDA